MDFKDKYSTKAGEAYNQEDKDGNVVLSIPKKVISEDAYALGDMIQELINKIEHARSSLMK